MDEIRLLLFGLVIALLLGPNESLKCFQCAETTDTGHCALDVAGLLNASLGLPTWYHYAKDCTASKTDWTLCMIQTTETNGKKQLFHRGCHDGHTFDIGLDSPRFHNISANNDSTCAYVKDTNLLVCYSFCDEDFCNGPQPEPQKVCNFTISSDGFYENVENPCHGLCLLPEVFLCLLSLMTSLYFI
ncbi:hypothetical protein Bpfe_005392 [Biomphalaria pfeifferi]|uniref:Protein quiver n=1 Tax=Biomphalaria pfeifferi TaxID=112525 RepID=A0AAD8C2K7_BIOPF|nr:hypothetical protein Bpfe_005392 [Biomphalaria pfeifferi]